MRMMRVYLLLLLVTIACGAAFAQQTGNNGLGNGGKPGGSNTQLQYNNSGLFGGITNGSSGSCLVSNGVSSVPSFGACSGSGGVTATGSPIAGELTGWSSATGITNVNLAGDCTTSNTFTLTCLYTNGVAFGTFATANAATPPAIGTVTPAAGAFTTLSASSTVSGTGFSTYLASPPAIGGSTASTGAFTNLSASGSVSGIGFSNYFASPPGIGTSAPGVGNFTSITASGAFTSNITGSTQCVHANSSGVLSGTGSDCGSGGGGGSPAFGSITSGTNNSAAMLVGTGSSLGPNGTGVVTANALTSATTVGAVPLSQPNEFNIVNYGAKCDGTTDDTADINAAFTAALASAQYNNSGAYGAVVVSGPKDSGHPPCLVGSSGSTHGVNATGFNAWATLGNGLSAGKLVIRDLNLVCSDPSSLGVICLDTANSMNVDFDNVSIMGTSSNPPQIGLQEANAVGGSQACCIHHARSLQVFGSFKFTALYNMASESATYQDAMFSNGYESRGSIFSIGSITGGTGYDGGGSGTFASIALTGGSGVGATANITVASGVVTKVLMNNWGKGYVSSDNLSATTIGSAGGSGLIVPVSTLITFACVFDGQNHWGVASSYGTVTAAVDTQLSFTQLNMKAGSCRGNLGAVWLDATTSANFDHVYVNSEDSTAAHPGMILFDNGVASNFAPNLDFRTEANKSGGVGDIYFTGTNAGPTIAGMRVRIDYEKGGTGTGTLSPNMFNIDPALTVGNTGGLNLPDLEVHWPVANKLPMFDAPNSYTVSGRISTLTAYNWNAPFMFTGTVCPGGLISPARCFPSAPNFGAADIVVPAGGSNLIASAGSCDRLLNTLVYTGPLCSLVRASDGATKDLRADSYGNASYDGFASWCANTTCALNFAYDQSGNGINAIPAASANQPAVAFDPIATGNLSIQFTSAGAQAITIASGTGPNNIFGNAGGACGFVVSRAATGVTGAGLASKYTAGTGGWQVVTSGTTNPDLAFNVGASSTNGSWTSSTTIPASQLSVVDVEYYNASDANVPTMRIAGTAVSFGSSTTPVGTIGSDAGTSLIIGNTASTGGTHAWAGGVLEWVCFAGTTALNGVQLEAWGRNAASHYGINGTNGPVVH